MPFLKYTVANIPVKVDTACKGYVPTTSSIYPAITAPSEIHNTDNSRMSNDSTPRKHANV
ncbi:hypothetical protein BDV26DRAFT_269842 [Aspergillus bertholletiae]|uniref:Uncharacterized protein n=1 Tax=Aspergillus bertholletiae TaxID=1226010 RepID=A0A5N7AX98_9EURO|nr:hypothetical protein BDV26DRAFT_269842 [Aspergillus bertholletiae]